MEKQLREKGRVLKAPQGEGKEIFNSNKPLRQKKPLEPPEMITDNIRWLSG